MGLESTKHELQNNLRINRFQITLIAATTIATILISLYCLFSGLFIVFQNLFYVPIILSCMYYTMRGFIYSVCLAVLYLLLILVFTSQSSIIMQALVRVFIFIIVAGVVTFLSARNKQDITERKRAEELLRQQKEEQQVIFDAVPAMIFFKDTENRFIRVNRALAQASGMTVEQMEGKSCFELFPDLADKYWKDDSEVIAAGVPKRDIIESMATPNGVAWVKTDKIPYWDEKGKIAGVICFSIDITALINTENALRKHFLFLETLIDTIPNPIFYKNIKGEYTGCNDAFAAYMGILKEEILGKTVYDLSPKELADVYKKTDQELFDHPGVQVYETQIKYADEALRDVVFNKATFTDEDGNVNGLVGVILDITDRKRAELLIQESEERYRMAIEYSNDGVALVEGDQHIYVNQKFLDIFGYEKPEDIIGKSPFVIVHPDDHEMVMEYNRKRQRGESVSSRYEFKGIKKDGANLFIEVSAAKITYHGKTVSLAYLRDITERKGMEEKLQTMSLTDELTGLYNRRGFFTLSQQQMKVAERTKKDMLLFFADLDKMKQINDTLGHHEGDKALIDIATILKEVFRESDIIGRMGGDEFAILAIDTTDETREVLIKRLRNILDNYNRPEGRSYQLSLSIGIAHYDPETPLTLDELMTQADTLMYEEKRKKH